VRWLQNRGGADARNQLYITVFGRTKVNSEAAVAAPRHERVSRWQLAMPDLQQSTITLQEVAAAAIASLNKAHVTEISSKPVQWILYG
jgi:hypothetical protein